MADPTRSCLLIDFWAKEIISFKELLDKILPKERLERIFKRRANVQLYPRTRRMDVEIEEAKGLSFSPFSEKQVIYRDFKSSNILLDTKNEVNETNNDWGLKMTSPLQDKSIGCNLNKYEEPFSHEKCKKTVQRFLSCLIATIVFLWITMDTCTYSSIVQLDGLVYIWSSWLEPLCFIVFILAVPVTIVVGAPFPRMQSAMLMFWAILMLVRSAKSITEVYVPILGIIFTGCCVLVEKQP